MGADGVDDFTNGCADGAPPPEPAFWQPITFDGVIPAISFGTDSLVGFGYYEEFIERLRGENVVFAATPAIKSFALG